MVGEQLEQRSNLVEVRALRHLAGVLVPPDEPVVLQFREVNVVHLDEALDLLGRRFVLVDLDPVVVLWIVDQQCTQ